VALVGLVERQHGAVVDADRVLGVGAGERQVDADLHDLVGARASGAQQRKSGSGSGQPAGSTAGDQHRKSPLCLAHDDCER
jgi:hypothetical protein